ncbi:MAG: hypothetical protein AAGK97_11000 [Bacteroidota bacterium]
MKRFALALTLVFFFVLNIIHSQSVSLELKNVVNTLELKGTVSPPSFKLSQALGTQGELKILNNNLELNHTGDKIILEAGTGDVEIRSKINVGDSPTTLFSNPDKVGDIKYNNVTNDLEGFTSNGWQSLTAGSNQNGNQEETWGNAGNCAMGIGAVNDFEQFIDPANDYLGNEVDMDSCYAIASRGVLGGGTCTPPKVYKLSNGDWEQVAELSLSTNYPNHCLGQDVAINKEFTFVRGAIWINVGSIFIYKKGVNGWQDMVETQVITVTDIITEVVVNDETMLARTTDHILIYELSGGVWVYQAKLSSTTQLGKMAIANDHTIVSGLNIYVKPVGGWVDMDESATIALSDVNHITVNNSTIIASYNGNLYVFQKPMSGWAGSINANQTIFNEYYSSFGHVSMDDHNILVGSAGETIMDCNGNTIGHGKCYLFKLNTNGIAEFYSTITSPVPVRFFGTEVAIDHDRFIIGAPGPSFANSRVVFGRVE